MDCADFVRNPADFAARRSTNGGFLETCWI